MPGTWVVPVEAVSEPSLLRHVVQLHVGESTLAGFFRTLPGPFDPSSGMNAEGELLSDGIPPLRGGIALEAADEHGLVGRITPECCGDLSNWREWLNATRATEERWMRVWIGHPEALVRAVGQRLTVQKVLESGEPTGRELWVETAELREAVDRARRTLAELVARLEPVFRAAVVEAGLAASDSDAGLLAGRFAEHLAGLAEFQLD